MSSIPLSKYRNQPSASPPSALMICSACETANRADRKYCGTCGARLWEPCLGCGQPNAASEKHCGGCGANLANDIRHATAGIEAEFAEAERLAADSLHPQAIDRLLALEIADHSALARHRQTATERVAALRSEMLRCNRESDQAIVTGRELLAACDYEQAAILLESIAEPCRTAELRQLLDLVRGRQIEMLTLVAEIRHAVAEKRSDGLLPKVEELLRLKPDHPQARTLAERLRPLDHKKKVTDRDALYSAAKTHLEQHEYAAALERLEQIPDNVRTPQLIKLIDEVQAKAAEVAWLSRDLRQAVAYDEHLLPIAERLAKLRPDDPDATSLLRKMAKAEAQISRRALAPGSQPKPDASRASGNGLSPVPGRRLVEPPTSSVWGPPLETITAFNRIESSSLDSACFKSSRDRFGVAAGLALQALGRAAINVNLVPPEKTGILGLLKSKKKPITSAWGIDVGRAAIKAIRLSLRPTDDCVAADAVELVEHARMLNAPEADAQTTLRETLDKLCERVDLTSAPVCISLPAHKTLFRPIALPLVDEKKLAELMKFEVRQQIPFPVEYVVWDYQLLAARTTHVEYLRECEVALLAIKIDEVPAAIAPFAERDLKVELLTSDAVALLNFVMFDGDAARSQAPPGNPRAPGSAGSASRVESHQCGIADTSAALRDPVTVLLDVGTDSSNLIITNGASLAMRSIPLGGNSFSRVMVKEFQLTFAQAEKVKRNPTAVRQLHRLYAALEPRFVDLAQELHRTIDGFLQVDSARRLARFVVTGDGLKLHGALRRLWHGP